MKYLNKLKKLIKKFFKVPFFGFVKGHSHLSLKQIKEIKSKIEIDDNDLIRLFEKKFSEKVGTGNSVSFATGRMGFYSLMKILDIKQGDEVILQGYTCSVMPNAIYRVGATPIYADISLHNLGTSPESVKSLISENTKMIVVQHSFGIPCEVEEIKMICKERDIFLLEDCAISLGSKVHGIQIGNFGDAALYSFDHSKPINAMTGGLIYSTNNELINSLMKIVENIDHLSARHNHLIFNDFIRERKICIPEKYGRDDLHKFFRNFSIKKYTYLDEDFERKASSSYPYPAKLPSFVAQLGLYEIERWDDEIIKRREMLKDFIDFFIRNDMKEHIPESYFDSRLEIVPSRLILLHKQAEKIKDKFNSFLQTNWFWFTSPISECSDPKELGYVYGSCKNSETAAKEILNLPCVHEEKYNNFLFEKSLSAIKQF